jgi:GTPase
MKFHSLPLEEHAEVPLADAGRLEDLVSHWTRDDAAARPAGRNACYVVSVQRRTGGAGSDARLDEMVGLVETQGDRVVGREICWLERPDPRTLIRGGVAQRLAERARACGADLLVLDAELTPSQARNLEVATGIALCDREAVILNVFERHAATRRARIQVAIAHLEYLRPRIRGIGLNMDQQTGANPGGRGPGETASELLARQLDGRLADLRSRLARLERSDAEERRHRRHCARVVLVGYTNAGKTSLMNALTHAGLSSRDRLFETLDTTSRALSRHGGDVLLSDTVGFIRDLPDRLFASFASTLAEVVEASLLLVVLDVSSPEIDAHLRTTHEVLEQLGAADVPRLVVFNKTDVLEAPVDPAQLAALSAGHPHIALSSQDPAAVGVLRQAILERVRAHHRVREVFVPYGEAEIVGRIYARCRVLESTATPTGTQFVIEGEAHTVDELARATRRNRR